MNLELVSYRTQALCALRCELFVLFIKSNGQKLVTEQNDGNGEELIEQIAAGRKKMTIIELSLVGCRCLSSQAKFSHNANDCVYLRTC